MLTQTNTFQSVNKLSTEKWRMTQLRITFESITGALDE